MCKVAERMEAELGEEKWQFIDGCQREWDTLPPPGPPLIVGLDGGFIHAKEQKSRGEGWFEVIAGKSMPEEGAAKCLSSHLGMKQQSFLKLAILQTQLLDLLARRFVVYLADSSLLRT